MSRRTILLLLLLLLSAYPVAAEESVPIAESATGDDEADAALAAHGIRVVAWRNDTFDADEDGRLDAVRVVLALNTTNDVENSDLNILVEAIHDGRSVQLWQNFTLTGAAETSLQVDAWGMGFHLLRLQMFDPQSGVLLADLDAGEWNMAPALAVASLGFELQPPGWLETGDDCTVKRLFVDQIGERYEVMGQRDLRGTPFVAYEWDDELDCSSWPAGTYSLHESYQNGLGQNAEAWLNMTIHNRPAPVYYLQVIGDGEEFGSTCILSVNAQTIDSHEQWTYTWDTIPDHGIGDVSEVDCSAWQPGVHLLRLEVVNEQGISTTSGMNLIRLTPFDVVDSNVSENQSMAWPVRSGGDSMEDSEGGLYGVGSAALLIFFICVIVGIRSKDEDSDDVVRVPLVVEQKMLTPIEAYQRQWGEPQEGVLSLEDLPTTVDSDGVRWRRHPDGKMDWYDEGAATWVVFE